MEKIRTETSSAPCQCSAQHRHSLNFEQGFAVVLLYAHPENKDEFVSAKTVYVICKKQFELSGKASHSSHYNGMWDADTKLQLAFVNSHRGSLPGMKNSCNGNSTIKMGLSDLPCSGTSSTFLKQKRNFTPDFSEGLDAFKNAAFS